MSDRVRFGFKPSPTKGTVSLDVTAESADPAKAQELLRDGIVRFKAVAVEEGYIVVEPKSAS